MDANETEKRLKILCYEYIIGEQIHNAATAVIANLKKISQNQVQINLCERTEHKLKILNEKFNNDMKNEFEKLINE